MDFGLLHKTLHSPLLLPNATRLLTLQPGRAPEPISATLHEISLDDDHKYECLSYTWGDDPASEVIKVNDLDIPIRRNLWHFLIRIRLTDHARVVWVDAISISQTDLVEKAMQVGMIGSIFRKASRVLVWLGEHADGSQLVFRRFLRPWRQSWREATQPSSQTVSHEEEQRRLKTGTAFFARPYWSRTWIIQEIALAKSLVFYCGPDTADWTLLERDFDDFRLWVNERKFHRVAAEGDISASRDKFLAASWAGSALINARYTSSNLDGEASYVFSAFERDHGIRYSKCHDRRDKIYGLLSLEDDDQVRGAIGVDYRISIPQLFVRVLRAVRHNHDEGNWQRRTNRLVLHMELSKEELTEAVDVALSEEVHLDQAMVDIVTYIVIHFLKIRDESFDAEFSSRLDGPRDEVNSVVEDQEEQERLRKWRDDARRRGIWPITTPKSDIATAS